MDEGRGRAASARPLKYISYAACHRHIIRRLPPDKFEQFMRGPDGEAETRVVGDPDWVAHKRAIVAQGVAAPGVDEKVRLYDRYLQKMDDVLAEGPWLVGAAFSLADISLTPYVNRLDMLGTSELWTRSAAATGRLVRAHQGATGIQTVFPGFLPARPNARSQDLRLANLAESETNAGDWQIASEWQAGLQRIKQHQELGVGCQEPVRIKPITQLIAEVRCIDRQCPPPALSPRMGRFMTIARIAVPMNNSVSSKNTSAKAITTPCR